MPKIIDRYFQVDPWKVIEEGFDPSHGRNAESVFSLGNEFMGVRGYFEEGYSGDRLMGSYFNGVFTKNVLRPFWCKGLAHSECFIINSIDWLYTRITLNGEQLDLAKCKFHNFKRVLDMKSGTLSREFTWETSDGKLLKLSFLRFTSMDVYNLGCQRITFKPVNFSGSAEIQSCLDFSTIHEASGKNYWTCLRKQKIGDVAAILGKVHDSGQQVFSSFKLNLPSSLETKPVEDEKLIGVKFSLPLTKGKTVSIEKMVVNYAEKKNGIDPDEVWKQGLGLAEKHLKLVFGKAFEGHGRKWSGIWDNLDIKIEGDPEIQQGVRFAIFNLHQAYHGADSELNIPSRGMTGEVGGGRVWWVNETYCMPFYLFNYPEAARNLVEYRYRQLPQAVERAKEVDCTGARYPLTTLDGTESCTWWEHSLIQIHVGASVPYGIWNYVHLCRDKDFLYNRGIEVLLQTSRYFASRGQWSPLTGEFGFYCVMGPDELHMMVQNNRYTNIMAKKTFEYTLQVIDEMREKALPQLNAVFAKVGLEQSELDDWRQKAAKMRINPDKNTGIYQQHDSFFNLPHIDIESIPADQFPVEDHWAYDRIFRYDMIRKPDVLLLLFLYSQEFSMETKRVNYEYYEPRCSHESSHSPSIHSILAAEIGKHEKAYEYAKFASRLDLDDYNRDTGKGLHVTSMAGTWMNMVYGFGGMRTDGEKLVFNPSIPKNWKSFGFNILYLGTRLNIQINRESVILKACEGPAVSLIVFDIEYVVDSESIEIKLPAERLG
jgi:maltose phosphorylase